MRAHRAAIVLVVDQTLMMVSCCHGVVRASSVWPPQMSTTSSPSMVMAADAPTSSSWSMVVASASRTPAKRGSKVPWISAMNAASPQPRRPDGEKLMGIGHCRLAALACASGRRSNGRGLVDDHLLARRHQRLHRLDGGIEVVETAFDG